MGEPILLRIVTRLAHSRSGVEHKAEQPQNDLAFSDDPRQFILLPGNARKRYKVLLQRQEEFIKASEESPYNRYVDGPNKNWVSWLVASATIILWKAIPKAASIPY